MEWKMNEESRYKPKRFERQLFEVDKTAFYRYMRKIGKSTCESFSDTNKLHVEWKVRPDGVHYWIRDKRGNVIKSGIEQ